MTGPRWGIGRGRPESPLGIVGPGGGGGPAADSAVGVDAGGTESGREPRRFAVPSAHRAPDGSRLPELLELRRVTREGAFLLGVDRVAVFLFGLEGEPTRQAVSFDRSTRRFAASEDHSPGLAREARTLLESVSRVEVPDLRENAPPPGAMRDYLDEKGVRALLVLPLKSDRGIVGFITFEETFDARAWSERDRERARGLIRQLEGFLTPALLQAVRSERRRDSPTWVGGEAATGPKERPVQGEHPVNGIPPRAPDAAVEPPAGAEEADSAAREEGELRAFDTRLPSLRALEGAAVVGADLGEELLHLIEVQDGTLLLLGEVLDGRPEEAGELVADLHEVSTRLRRGLESFVEMTKDGMVKGEVVDLSQALSSMIHRLAGLVGPGPRFVVSPSVDPLPVRANPFLLQRALEHLVRNAREAVGPGGRIRIAWGRAEIPPERVARRPAAAGLGDPGEPLNVARIRVEDDGQGIRPEHLPWVFEPYFSIDVERGERLDRTGPEEEGTPFRVPGRGGPGRGLGLTVVQAVIEGHGGWVDLHSQPGDGTLVTLHLPLAEDAGEERTGAHPAPEPEASPPPRGSLILLLEDEPLLVRLLDRILTRAGHRVEAARSVSEARILWDRLGARADVVILERQLPGGEDPLSLVKDWAASRDGLTLLLLDRRAGPSDEPPEGVGPDAYFVRPFDPSDVARRIARKLARRAPHPGGDALGDRESGSRGGPEPPVPPRGPTTH